MVKENILTLNGGFLSRTAELKHVFLRQQIGLSISQLSIVYNVCQLLQGCSFYDQLDNVIENENARKSQLLVPE